MAYKRNQRFPELFKPGDGSVWWMFVPNPQGGKQLRESTGHRDERAAHARYLERVRAPRGPVEGSKERTLAVALVTRVEWLEAARVNEDPSRKKLARSTIKFYESHGRPLIRILGEHTLLSALDHETIRGYVVARTAEGVKGTTIAKDFVALSCALRFARKDGINAPSFEDIVPEDFVAVYVPRERWCTDAEVDTLVFSGILPPEKAAVIAFIVATSATYPSEVLPIRPPHVEGYAVHIPGTKRGSRDRFLEVPSHARALFDFAMKHLGPWGFTPWTHIGRDLKTIAKILSKCPRCREDQARISRGGAGMHKKNRPAAEPCAACQAVPVFAPLSPNDLRRTFAQWLVRSGVPYELVYPMMGHSSDRMLSRVYGRRDPAALAKLVELALKNAPKGARRTG